MIDIPEDNLNLVDMVDEAGNLIVFKTVPAPDPNNQSGIYRYLMNLYSPKPDQKKFPR